MNAVLISIQPKWCELIASGKKILEVRKTRPNIKTPFKCYIYCTKKFYRKGDGYFQGKYCGKVIGEFICKSTLPISITYSNPNDKIALREFPYTCLSDKEIMDYLGNGKQGWGWHISNLVIYDEPKELSAFWQKGGVFNSKRDNIDDLKVIGTEAYKPITRPPQSWCYVKAHPTEKGGVQE